MPIQELTHNGRKIVIRTEGDQIELTIDNEPIPLWHDKATGQFIATRHSPFKSYSTVLDLAKHVTDDVINQRRG